MLVPLGGKLRPAPFYCAPFLIQKLTNGFPLRTELHTAQEYASLFQQGDEKALAFFYQKFHPALAFYADRFVENRSIAEEIASEAFVKTWRMHWKLNSYAGIRAYLYKTVRRDCQRSLKKEQKRSEIHRSVNNPTQTEETPFDQLVRAEVYRLIHSALKELSPGSQLVLTMHYLEGKTTSEIAAELHLSDSTIRTQKTRGLKTLRKKLLRPLLILFYLFMKFFLPIL
jgi:RNA polymerase sigma-70 factor (ECF subfamily)